MANNSEELIDYFYITDESGNKFLVLPDLTLRLVKVGKRKRKADADSISFKL